MAGWCATAGALLAGLLTTPAVAVADAGPGPTSAGGTHTCQIRTHRLFCWGDNEYGAVGVASPDAVPSPVPVVGG